MKSLFALITEPTTLSLKYFKDIKEYDLFMPLLEIKEIEADPFNNIEAFEYTRERILHMVQYVAYAFSKQSPYLKSSDSVYSRKLLVIDGIGVDDELKKRIMKYQIPELDQVVKDYIKREHDDDFREIMTAQIIYDRLLHEAANPQYKDSIFDAKSQSLLFENSEKIKSKIFELRQRFENTPAGEMVKDFVSNVKSLHATDLIP